MAKPQAPLLSLGASGTIAKTLTFARWKGRAYVKHHVAGEDPRTPAQALARDTFKTGDALWVPAPALFKAPWDRFAAGQVKSGYNAWLGRFVRDNIGRTDLLNLTFSPGAAGGLATSAITLTAGVSSITVDFTNPAPPIGWTLESAIAAAIRDGDPATTTLLEVTAGEDAVAQAQVVLSGLTGGVLYVVGAWLRWRKPDGSIAYAPSLTGTATPAAGVTVKAVHFDGVNDYLSRGAQLTGAVDSKTGTMSVWLKRDADGAANTLWSLRVVAAGEASLIQVGPDDLLLILLRNTANANILIVKTLSTILVADGWTHVLASWDQATSTVLIFIDDVDDTAVPSTNLDQEVDYTRADAGIGHDWSAAGNPGTNKMNGDLAEFWFEDGVFLDLTIDANRRKFISAAGKPVDLGVDGALPTGTSPLIFLSGATVDWHTNKGTGGGFTEIGALTTASSSPSD